MEWKDRYNFLSLFYMHKKASEVNRLQRLVKKAANKSASHSPYEKFLF
ncbi:hypothetical protein A33Q_3577 [Indibacter alkaliphilus LW1]|uniref:Uncharacterized protein n=1 Tax=Indibacter alkaliphilus (strain CCUG 57479 / KCTC 22604 / LW1) TaxID=1189612 RepID=S2DNV9_INDAL|nr:hypothetical protein [Indibacter alkaliphilus]EOZ93631.1 hypothetical protein A33Q_3577 [Indibacter alkaliphilus LW1]